MRRVVVVLACAGAGLGALAPAAPSDDTRGNPLDAVFQRGARYTPKPAGTVERLNFWFGPYLVPPGHDSNRVDIDLPLRDGFILAIEPGMRRTADLTEPSHQQAHIHHAHWFAADPGNKEDNYARGLGEWIFGNGDEETRADFQQRSDADPEGPIYGQYIGAGAPQAMIYMLHNKTSEPLSTYIVLDVLFKHGTEAELAALGGRPHRDLSGILFGRTFNVPREPEGDGEFNTTHDLKRPVVWVSTIEGTIVGTGPHLHPGGKRVVVENLGSAENPCPDDGRGFGGTDLLNGEAVWRNGVFSEDFQMEVTNPAWRAPIHKGDRILVTGIYENRDHAWYDVMTHQGMYVDPAQPPRGRCAPYLVGEAARPRVRIHRHRHVHRMRRMVRTRHGGRRAVVRRRVHIHRHRHRVVPNPTAGVLNRPWDNHVELFCGPEFGGPVCESEERERPTGRETSLVTIADFLYVPGDRALSGPDGGPVRVKRGTPLTFVNADQAAGIRHSVTTCAWPCTGAYVANYPFADGTWDSDILGYDPVDGGSPNPVAQTPANLPTGKYSYFCRIHPWMRGAFEVVD